MRFRDDGGPGSQQCAGSTSKRQQALTAASWVSSGGKGGLWRQSKPTDVLCLHDGRRKASCRPCKREGRHICTCRSKTIARPVLHRKYPKSSNAGAYSSAETAKICQIEQSSGKHAAIPLRGLASQYDSDEEDESDEPKPARNAPDVKEVVQFVVANDLHHYLFVSAEGGHLGCHHWIQAVMNRLRQAVFFHPNANRKVEGSGPSYGPAI
ncbi:hypothetical protein M433DRAFT_454875 [Acidomyces richmondensis BFW]|nr:hypothetical protein M433DRAFT_454875 [Acidomyces richmondensis BFW]